MNICDYLDDGNRRIQRQLHEILENFYDWSTDVKFEHVCRALDEVDKHFEWQDTVLLSVIDSEGSSGDVQACLEERKKIQDRTERLLMSHVDDTDFVESLKRLLREIDSSSHQVLLRELTKHISSGDLKALNEKLEEQIYRV
jgi:hypothetical protein